MDQQPGIEIGATLRDRRKQLGLDMATVEQETKIRIRYLRALENEDWEILPASSYVRAFLRTYAQLLGLDGDALADEYRLRFEGQRPAPPVTRSESVLSARKRDPGYNGFYGFDRSLIIGAGVAVIVVLLILLSVLGGGSDEGTPAPSGDAISAQEQADRKAAAQRKKKADAKAQRKEDREMKLEIIALSDLQAVCVTDRKGKQLFADEFFEAGQSQKFKGERRYGLDIGAGNLNVKIDGKSRPQVIVDPASYEISGGKLTEGAYRGPGCG